MKEIIYRCDVCKKPKERDELSVYYVDEEGELDISTEKDDIELINSDSYICKKCMAIIYDYQKEEIETEAERI